ncbi:MAG: beta-propeller domain-containing protein [Acidimicrobiales bacterium]
MKIIAWCSALLLLVGVAVALDDMDGERPVPPAGSRPFALEGATLASASSLRAFEDCGELLDYFREEATAEQVWSGFAYAIGGADAMAVAEDSRAAGATAGGSPVPAPSGLTESPQRSVAGTDEAAGFSGTNLQEIEVDEPDIVKTDGEVIVAVAGTELHVIDPTDGAPRLLGVVALPENGSSELLLTGDRVTVLTRTYGSMVHGSSRRAVDDMVMGGGQPTTILTAVDIADPSDPEVVGSRTFEGDYASARMTGTLARLVLRSSPSLGQPEPSVLEHDDVEKWAEDAIAGAPLEAWLPSGDDGPIVACDAVARPEEPAGTGTITVLTIDVASTLDPQDATAVVANAETVYASTDRLYVATTDWGSGCCMWGMPMPVEGDGGIGDAAAAPAPQELTPLTTDLHAFDTTGATTPYLGSGRVEGRLLNSFSLSEHEGTLRVATTIDSMDGSAPSESAVVTLAEEGGALVERGRLAGLGTTEQIYAVRYQGDIAYVVTFRQTDPLYTIDLSDPASPRLLGELKIPGYSAYLHPAEDGRLIGVGQDATDEGRTEGAQVSTFDVTDLASPAEEDRLSFPQSHSAVEYEHRAFLWWAAERVVVLPLETYAWDEETGEPDGQPFLGAVAVDVAADGTLSERGRVSHQDQAEPESYPMISRSLVIGGTLYTLSEVGLLASDLGTLAETGWLTLT